MVKLFKNIIPLILVGSMLFAQNDYDFSYDYTQFYADSSSNQLEIFYELNPEGFKVFSRDSISYISMIIEIRHSNNSNLVSADTVKYYFKTSDINPNSSLNRIFGINKIIIPEGKYNFTISVLNDSSYVFLASDEFEVKVFSNSNPVISDIQLARSIKPDTTSTPGTFTKNTLEVIPNASAAYSSDTPLLQFYSELYNVRDKDLQLSSYLISPKSEVLFSESKQITTSNKSIVQVDQLNLLRYPSGVYKLQLILSDSTDKYAYSAEKTFYFYNKLYSAPQPDIKSAYSDVNSSMFAFKSSEECDEIFEKSKYIATDNERDQYDKLVTEESKRSFIFNFWKSRSQSSELSADEIYDDYMTRVEEANIKFKVMNKEGYKTERGRIYLTYGKPSRVESYPNESNLKPHEMWYYDSIEGGVYFVFGDLNGFGNYELLHSTKRGEVYDESWQRRLY